KRELPAAGSRATCWPSRGLFPIGPGVRRSLNQRPDSARDGPSIGLVRTMHGTTGDLSARADLNTQRVSMSGSPTPFARRSLGILSRIAPDRRRHKRLAATLLGRFMRANKQEYPCRLMDASAGGAAILAPVGVDVGERVVAYFDHLGGIEGPVVRGFE